MVERCGSSAALPRERIRAPFPAILICRAFYEDMSSLESGMDVDKLPPPAPKAALDDVPCTLCGRH